MSLALVELRREMLKRQRFLSKALSVEKDIEMRIAIQNRIDELKAWRAAAKRLSDLEDRDIN